MIKLGLKDYISSFVNNSELEKIDKLSFYISFDIEELMNLNKKFFITALSLLILDDSERLDNLKEKNRLYFLDKLFPDFTFEMLLQTNCLIELLISSKDIRFMKSLPHYIIYQMSSVITSKMVVILAYK